MNPRNVYADPVTYAGGNIGADFRDNNHVEWVGWNRDPYGAVLHDTGARGYNVASAWADIPFVAFDPAASQDQSSTFTADTPQEIEQILRRYANIPYRRVDSRPYKKPAQDYDTPTEELTAFLNEFKVNK